MSHSPERKEKDCLNCGTYVHGKYCHKCGQENIEPKESFLGMVSHFFNDITHFDGKFFTSLKDLFLRPGFLSREYMRGRRASYLHPVRMYVFTSALFFLVFFSMRGGEDLVKTTKTPYTPEERAEYLARVNKSLLRDSTSANLRAQLAILTDTTREVSDMDLLPYEDDFVVMSTIGYEYKSQAQYDSMQAAMPLDDRDGWFKRTWNKRAITLNEKYKGNKTESWQRFTDKILHTLPYLLFVSLPFFALMLRLLYIRRKQFFYADHAIFSIHHYVLSFILLLLVLILDKINQLTGQNAWSILSGLLFISGSVFLYLAMKRFYGQGHFKTFMKFLFLNISGLILISILFAIFTLFSIFQL